MAALITKSLVDREQPGEKVRFVWDTKLPGFGLKIMPSGHKSYVYQYRLGGREARSTRMTIGSHGPLTPDAARGIAQKHSAEVLHKRDPQQAERKRRRDAVDLNFESYADRFIKEHYSNRRASTARVNEGYIRRHAIPALRRMSLKDVTKQDVAMVLSGIESQASRHNTFSAMRKLFQWAIGRGDIDGNPMRDMDKPQAPPSRERVLSDPELAHVWNAAPLIGAPFGSLVRMLMLTGQRLNEVASLDWKELDRADTSWTLPAARSKNANAHVVPLAPLAIAVLDDVATSGADGKKQADEWPKRGPVFPSVRGGQPVSGFSYAKQRLDRRLAEQVGSNDEGLFEPEWRFHDLRRTLATGLQRLGVRLEVNEAALNHISGSRAGVTGIYQRHDWKAEKRTAFELWSKHLNDLGVEI